MKIKTKLTLGVGVLFLLIILLVGIGTKYMYALKSDTENILVTNYNTMQYAGNMLSTLDDRNPKALEKFEKNLQKQEKNISEIGEKEITLELRSLFEQYKSSKSDSLLPLIRKEIFKILEMNMQAIQRKSDVAKNTATNATVWIAMTGTLCFMIAFVLLFNLPSSIANPIKELTESIKHIAARNYSERVNFESHNEFGELAKSFNTMAEKLEEYNSSNLAKLMMEKKRVETLINNMHDPVIGLDSSLKVLFANEESLKIIGLKDIEFIGQNAKDLAISNDVIRLLLQDLVSTEDVQIKNKAIKINAHAKESYFEKESIPISIVPTGEKDKTLVGYFIILRNVTEYKELDFAKTNFIATVSHEFKTPISAIKMSLQLLENEQIGKLNEEQKNLVESIQDDANRLLKITSELLNMTQVESGNIQLAILPANPQEIMQYAINANKTQAEQRHIHLETHFPENLPLVIADNEKTAWVLTNLISNAIRYSYDKASIYLAISVTSAPLSNRTTTLSNQPSNSTLDFIIRDTGQGIAPQYKDKIFDRYFRVPGTQKEGTGLGLAISKEFIEAQGGKITVESELGVGSTFTVSLNAST